MRAGQLDQDWTNIVFYDKAVAAIRSVDALNFSNDAHLRVVKSEGCINFPAALLAYCVYSVLWQL